MELHMIPKPAIAVGAWALLPYSQIIAAKLTVKTKFGDVVKLCEPTGDGHMRVPRALVSEWETDARTDGHPIDINCTVEPKNPEQAKIATKGEALVANEESFVLSATTGFGKTYLGSRMIAQRKRTTLIVVTKEDLMFQWRKELLKFTDLTDNDIGVAQQDKCDYKGKKVVLGMVHSLAKGKYPAEFTQYFGMVIFDEVHRMAAETFSEACPMFPAKVRVGLTATTNRSDGKSFIFHAHIGAIRVATALVQLPPKILFRTTGFKLPIVNNPIKVNGQWVRKKGPVHHTPNRMMGVYKAMAANTARNQIIVNFLKSAYNKGRHTIVFSDLKDSHLTPLMAMAKEAGIPAEDMGYYVGGMSEKAREASKKKRIIFATYAMTQEATDIPRLDTAVFATPRANITQALGRILREHPEKSEPVVLDLVDNASSVLGAFLSKRRTQYHKLNAKLVTL